jgi:hypothetical protein
MCPELWCRKLNLTRRRQARHVVCGRRGPLDLGVSSLWAGVEKRHPGVLAIEEAPSARPCCFKNLKGMMVERLQACEEAGQCAQAPWNRASGPGCRDKMTGSTIACRRDGRTLPGHA